MELIVMVGAESVLPAKARQQVERYLVARTNVAEQGPPAKRQHPPPVSQRNEVRALNLLLAEAEDVAGPIGVGRQPCPITSAARRMAAIVARIGGQRRRAVQEVGLLREAHGGIGREQHS